MLSDEAVTNGLQAGNAEALQVALERFGQDVQRLAFMITRNHQDAEEVTIDTFVTAWRKSGQLRDGSALRPWLLRVATRYALSRRRRNRQPPPMESPLGVGDAELDRIVIRDALDKLAPQTRAALALHLILGFTVAETASLLGKSPNTVKTQVRTGLQQLRASLQPAFSSEGRVTHDVRSS